MTNRLDDIDLTLAEMMHTIASTHPTPPGFNELMHQRTRSAITSSGNFSARRAVSIGVAAVLVLAVLVVGLTHRSPDPATQSQPGAASGFEQLETAVGCVDHPTGGEFGDVSLPGRGTICTLPTGQLVSIEFFAGVTDVREIMTVQSELLCQSNLTAVHGSNWIAWVLGDPSPLQALDPLGATPVACKA